MAMADIVIEEHNWPGVKDTADDIYAEQDIREVNALIRTRGCRRLVLGEYLDGDWQQDYQKLESSTGKAVALCDNCYARIEQRDEPGEHLGGHAGQHLG
jgi:hypothetical protein